MAPKPAPLTEAQLKEQARAKESLAGYGGTGGSYGSGSTGSFNLQFPATPAPTAPAPTPQPAPAAPQLSQEEQQAQNLAAYTAGGGAAGMQQTMQDSYANAQRDATTAPGYAGAYGPSFGDISSAAYNKIDLGGAADFGASGGLDLGTAGGSAGNGSAYTPAAVENTIQASLGNPTALQSADASGAAPNNFQGDANSMWAGMLADHDKGLDGILKGTYADEANSQRRMAEMNALGGGALGGAFAGGTGQVALGGQQNRIKARNEHGKQGLEMKMARLAQLIKQAEAGNDRELARELQAEADKTQLSIAGMSVDAGLPPPDQGGNQFKNWDNPSQWSW